MASTVAQRAAFSWGSGGGAPASATAGDCDGGVEEGLGVGGELLEGRGVVGLALLGSARCELRGRSRG